MARPNALISESTEGSSTDDGTKQDNERRKQEQQDDRTEHQPEDEVQHHKTLAADNRYRNVLTVIKIVDLDEAGLVALSLIKDNITWLRQRRVCAAFVSG